MDAILASLNAFRQQTEFAVLLPWLRLVVLGLMSVAVIAALSVDDVLGALRRSVRHAGLSDKQAAGAMGICPALYSLKVNGGRPLTMQTAVTLPAPVWQWFAVELATLVGTPKEVRVGAKLRQARMTLALERRKAGIA